jgi:hypothetical protein
VALIDLRVDPQLGTLKRETGALSAFVNGKSDKG